MLIYIDQNLASFKHLFQPYGKVVLFLPETTDLKNLQLKESSSFIISSKTRFFNTLNNPSLYQIKFIGTATSGTDHISEIWKNHKMIKFINAVGSNSFAVCDYTITAINYLIQRKHIQTNQETLGIIGFGHIGKKIWEISKIFGFRNIIVYDPYINLQKKPLCKLSTLHKEASFLTLHCSLTQNCSYPSYQFMTDDWISKMKKPFHLINTARGALATEKTLLKALKSIKIKSLILDVFPNEPHLNQELYSYCDIITPHIAGYSYNAKQRAIHIILKEFCTHFKYPYSPSSLTEEKKTIENITLDKAISQMYEIEKDHINFKNIYNKGYNSKLFSQIRSKYPLRKEFLEFIIKKPQNIKKLSTKTLKDFKTITHLL